MPLVVKISVKIPRRAVYVIKINVTNEVKREQILLWLCHGERKKRVKPGGTASVLHDNLPPRLVVHGI